MEDPEEVDTSPDYFVPLTRSSLTTASAAAQSQSRRDEESGKDSKSKSKPREDLREWNTLPLDMAQEFDERFANVPLQELDPYYTGTFVTITRDHRIHRFGASNALWILSPFSPLRRGAITILTHAEFSWFIICTVLVNLYFLATPTYSDWGFFEFVFVINFTVEFLIKLVARGFLLDKFAYLKDGWNILDFVILLFAYISLITGTRDGMAALRLLKLIPNIYDFRLAYRYFTEVIGHLFHVTILTLFVLSVFALLGQSMFMGLLTRKCIKAYPNDSDVDFESWSSNLTNWYPSYPVPNYPGCMNSTSGITSDSGCPEGYVCLQGFGLTPDYGYTSFDNFFWSLLSTIRMFKLDFWEALYQQLMRAGGYWSNVYFAGAMFVCSFYLLALICGVVANTVSESLEKRRSTERRRDILRRRSYMIETWTSKLRDIMGDIWNRICTCSCLPQCNKLQEWISLVIFGPVAIVIMKIIIILHTICLWLRHSEHSEDLKDMSGVAMEVFKVVYIIELVLKMVAVGPKQYFEEGWRKFECLVVVGTFLDYIVEAASPDKTFLWILRVLVVLRLAQHWPQYERLLSMITASFTKELGAFLCIIQLFLVTFALIGMEWFGISYFERFQHIFGEEIPRWNFVDFPHSYMNVFRALCGEWIETMWDCMYVGGTDCMLFYFFMVVIGNFLTLTFFILLYNNVVSTSEKKDKDEDERSNSNPFTSIVNRLKTLLCRGRNSTSGGPRPNHLANIEDEDEILGGQGPGQGQNHVGVHAANSVLFNLTEHKYFRILMVIIILSATLALCFDDIHEAHTEAVFIVDIIFTVLIILEGVLRFVGIGPWGYLRNGWCWLDFYIVILSITELFQGQERPRPLRAFRMLMVISRIPSLKKVVETIGAVLKQIFGTLLAGACLWLCFAVLGVAMLHGKFYKCYDPETGELANGTHVRHKTDCFAKNLTWENSAMNFDHVPNAFLSLLMVSSFKGWIGIMHDAIDATGIDKHPEKEVSFEMYLYFVVFILVCVFLTFGVVLAEAVIELNKLRKEGLPSFMERSELYYNSAMKLRGRTKVIIAPRPGGKCQGSLYTCFTGKTFDTVNATLMGVYLFILATEHEGMNELWYQVYFLAELAFILFITVEAILKVMVFRRHYFSDPLNIFDLCVVIFSTSGIYIAEVGLGHVSPQAFCIIRAARVVIGCLGDHMKGMRTLIRTVKQSFVEVAKAATVLLTVICSFALFGMLQFKHVLLRGPLDDLHNFQTFQQSFHVMYEVTTGAGWDGVLDAIANEQDCVLPDPTDPEGPVHSDCGNARVAITFLVSYLVACFLVIAYMFLTVIQEYFRQHVETRMELTLEELRNFDEVCAQFDSEGLGYVRVDQLQEFLDALQPPLQVKRGSEAEVNSVLKNLPVTQEELVSSEDVFAALVKRHFRNLNRGEEACGSPRT